MERKIGEIFEIDGVWYQCVEQIGCDGCAFDTICDEINDITGNCTSVLRHDDKSVVFKKLEKVGKPYSDYCPSGRVIYFQRYKCYQKPIYNGDFICWSDDISISIEIKQTKENMEEKKHCDGCKYSDEEMKIIEKAEKDVRKAMGGAFGLPKDIPYLHSFVSSALELGWLDKYKEHSNSENIGKNFKPFDLEAAKSGKPVCTRDGKKARIICFDVKGSTYPIIALIEEGEDERLCSYMPNGRRYEDEEEWKDDLMMLPEKKSGWVNVYRDEESKRVYCGEFIFSEREKAEKHYECNDTKVATVPVNWEE